jgi:large subunit ribosomal protein L35
MSSCRLKNLAALLRKRKQIKQFEDFLLRFGRSCYLCGPFLTQSFFVMPKMKTHSSAKKRFKVTGTGKVKRNRARLRHIASTKTKKQKRNLAKAVVVDKRDHARIERLLVI